MAAVPPPGEIENEVVRQAVATKGATGAKVAGAAGIKQEAARQVVGAKVAAGTKLAAGAKAAGAAGLEKEAARELLQAKIAAGAGAKGAAVVAGKGMAAQTAVAANPTGVTAGVAGSGGAQGLTTGGTIWSGKGLSLGLGLGLGIWGPVLVVAAGAAAVYGYMQYRKGEEVETDDESEELSEALAPKAPA